MSWRTVKEIYSEQQQARERERDAGGRFATGPNPFVKDARGRRNLTAINQLVRSSPATAKQLCRQAGEHWGAWCDTRAHTVADLSRDLSLGHR